MDRKEFKQIHSDLVHWVMVIENDLRLIYAAMRQGDFNINYKRIQKANLGSIIEELEELDHSDGKPEFSDVDYYIIHQIRTIRNYWCHQCYLDYVYIVDEDKREQRFQEIAKRLQEDENKVFALYKKTEQLRKAMIIKYRINL